MPPKVAAISKQLAAELGKPDPPPEPIHLEPGIYPDIPMEHYLRIEAVSMTSLKRMAESPAAYLHAVEHGTEDKPGFALGNAAHTAIQEPRRFPREYVEMPETRINEKGAEVKFVRSGKHWQEFRAQHEGKQIVTAKEYSAAWDIQERVRKHPAAAAALSAPGKFEVTIVWRHPATGIVCKCRVDHLGAVIDELKTAADITRRGFSWACYRLKYHWAAAAYQDAVANQTSELRPVRFIVVSKTAPHDCCVYRASDRFLDIGRHEYEMAMARLADCIESDTWPGISHEERELDLPDHIDPFDYDPELTIGESA